MEKTIERLDSHETILASLRLVIFTVKSRNEAIIPAAGDP